MCLEEAVDASVLYSMSGPSLSLNCFVGSGFSVARCISVCVPHGWA